jgi:cobyrinic acid a,c-diamide synthase
MVRAKTLSVSMFSQIERSAPVGFACPTILITAAASGQGKTTITSALARLHTRQGRKVRVFKCGPDFLDPFWHTLASGAPVHQLDLWMTGEADCRARLMEAATDADLILVEGVMGLFDGEPSAADLAQKFGLHVLAVVNASAMAETFGAVTFGLQHYRPGLHWAGVLANQVGSDRHTQMLQSSLRDPTHWLGAVKRNPAMNLPGRHLGLTVATELTDAMERLDAAADALAATPLGQMSVAELKRWEVCFESSNATADTDTANFKAELAFTTRPLANQTIAVARDAAFCFIYAANLDCLRELGAQIIFFSPLADSAVPACDALWIPGGYPELHAATIAANTAFRDSLAQHIARGKPVWAECGGMMSLFEILVTADGEKHSQWAILPGEVSMHKRLSGLGPQQLRLDSGLLRGHTFHYSTTATSLQAVTRTSRPNLAPMPDVGEALWQQGSVRCSYFHAWFPSCPAAVVELFNPSPRTELSAVLPEAQCALTTA